ncbi:MAG TPA: Dyp-type peroxidase, partial [Mycobacteriales bacterium]|nr:Dyp-type peroxidase [Mycobacteriales bacterium]
RNIKAEDTGTMKKWVWVGDETDQPWMQGGTYLVARRIQMHIEAWDRDFLADQEAVFGRKKTSGAPLTGQKEFDAPNFQEKDSQGQTVIPPNSHIRLASREHHSGMQILRRGFSYTDGIDPVTGSLDAGLFFICFQQNPEKQFVPLQRLLGSRDALSEYINHTGSAVFACPPGVDGSGEDYWGAGLFKS